MLRNIKLTPSKTVVMIISAIVMVLIGLLNAVFTYTYGTEVVGAFLLSGLVSDTASAQLSGLVSVLFFDVAYFVSFAVLIFGCKSVWQYGIVGLQFFVTFSLSVAASVVSILLLSPLSEEIPEVISALAQYAGYGALVVGFVVNAAATIGYLLGNPTIAAQVRDSVRSAQELADENNLDDHLYREVDRRKQQNINQIIPTLADMETNAAVVNWLASRGFNPNHAPALPSPSSSSDDTPPPLPRNMPGARWERVTVNGRSEWVLIVPTGEEPNPYTSSPARPTPNGHGGD